MITIDPFLVACFVFIIPLLALVMVLSARANNSPNTVYDRRYEVDKKVNEILLSQYTRLDPKP
jgi:hypothetical protein